jgi:hypothetical protein
MSKPFPFITRYPDIVESCRREVAHEPERMPQILMANTRRALIRFLIEKCLIVGDGWVAFNPRPLKGEIGK